MDHRTESGFTIIEVVAASAILATALVGLAQVIAVATTAVGRGRDVTRATLAAAQKVEELRSAELTTADATDLVDGRYVRRWTVTPLAEGSGVIITVDVTSLARSVPPVRLETIRTWPGQEAAP
jgi:prepilin-type N-terminal cleavage/methylation domain-containing protein